MNAALSLTMHPLDFLSNLLAIVASGSSGVGWLLSRLPAFKPQIRLEAAECMLRSCWIQHRVSLSDIGVCVYHCRSKPLHTPPTWSQHMKASEKRGRAFEPTGWRFELIIKAAPFLMMMTARNCANCATCLHIFHLKASNENVVKLG